MGSDPASNGVPEGNVVPLPDNDTPSLLLRRQFEVASVAKVAMPLGGQDGDWYCYVLASGPARITGYHRGSPEEVTAYAQNCAEDFNMRNATGKSTRAFASSKSR